MIDGTFCPDQTITRAEFVSILSSFYPLETGNVLFSDVPRTHWAYSAVLSAAAKGGLTDMRMADSVQTKPLPALKP